MKKTLSLILTTLLLASAAQAETIAAPETAGQTISSEAFASATDIAPAPLPEAEPETVAAEPLLAVKAFSLMAEQHEAQLGEVVTLTLTLTLSSEGALPDFGVKLGGEAALVSASGGVSFDGRVLWVRGGTARQGKVYVQGQELQFTCQVTPFPEGGTADSYRLNYRLVDENGHEIPLTTGGQIRSHADLTLRATAEDAEQTEVSYAPESESPATAAPEAAEMLVEEATAEPTAQPEAPETAAPVLPAVVSPEAAPEGTPAETEAPEQTEVSFAEEAPAESALPESYELRLRSSAAADSIQVGDVIVLTADPVGFEGLAYTLQWQECVDGEWVDLPFETSASLAVAISEKNIGHAWRYDLTLQ